jgi:23S rRNA-/tRNA-specific pseudouridylate synthase
MNAPVPVVLYEDQQFVVVDKPAGLAVHAGPSGGRSVEDWFPLLSRRKLGHGWRTDWMRIPPAAWLSRCDVGL